MIGIFLALGAAMTYGTSDFLGGLASRKLHQAQVLLLTSFSSLILLILLVLIWREHIPSVNNIIIAVFAGISGSLGLTFLYKGLSLGNAALVAPVSAVIGAVIPIIVGLFVEGLPSIMQMIGFVLSFLGIWLLSRSKDGKGFTMLDGLGIAIFAGIGFGGFFVLIAQIESELIFAPLVFTKLASIIIAIIFLRTRQLTIPKLAKSSIAIWSGFIDTGGNIFYLLATQFTRLDIAALLSSLYPIGTVLLSSIILKEKLSSYQWVGMSSCVVAIMFFTSG